MKLNLPKSLASFAVTALATVAFAPAAHAFSINVNNFSFEDPVLGPGGVSVATPPDWTGFNEGGGGVFDIGVERAIVTQYNPFDPLGAPAQGNNFLWLNKFNGTDGFSGGIFQDIGALLPNTEYTLTVALGSRADRINSPGIISLINGTDNTGSVLGTLSAIPATQNTWEDYSVVFTTGDTVSGNLTIMLSVLNAGTIQANFDNVRLDAVAVPEPSTIGLLMVAMLGGLIIVHRVHTRSSCKPEA